MHTHIYIYAYVCAFTYMQITTIYEIEGHKFEKGQKGLHSIYWEERKGRSDVIALQL